MLANDVVSDGRIQAKAARATFYYWQFANAGFPFVGAEGRIPRLARFVYPSNWIDIIPPAKESSEELNLCRLRQTVRSWLQRSIANVEFRWLRYRDTVLCKQGLQRFILST